MPERTITKLFQKWDYGKIQYIVRGGGDKPVLEMFVQPRANDVGRGGWTFYSSRLSTWNFFECWMFEWASCPMIRPSWSQSVKWFLHTSYIIILRSSRCVHLISDVQHFSLSCIYYKCIFKFWFVLQSGWTDDRMLMTYFRTRRHFVSLIKNHSLLTHVEVHVLLENQEFDVTRRVQQQINVSVS